MQNLCRQSKQTDPPKMYEGACIIRFLQVCSGVYIHTNQMQLKCANGYKCSGWQLNNHKTFLNIQFNSAEIFLFNGLRTEGDQTGDAYRRKKQHQGGTTET